MGKNPCFLFYPSDWDRDMGYHPLEIGGAWMLILCSLFWEGGSAIKTLQEWAKIIRENPKKTEKILEYLAQKSICDLLNQNGLITITARRMVRDIKIREIRKLAGSKGGNPLLTPSKKEIDLLNQNLKQNASKSQPPSVSLSVSDSIPLIVPNKKGTGYDEKFLRFWQAYPKRKGKDAAWKVWKKRNGDLPEIGKIIEAIKFQCQSLDWKKDNGQFIPHPATWLNQGRWEDEVETPKQKGSW